MSKMSNQPMWPIRTALPFSWPCPGARVTPWCRGGARSSWSPSMPSGMLIAVTTATSRRRARTARAPSPSRPHARRGRAARAARTPPRGPPSRSSPSATSRPRRSETAGVNAASRLCCAFFVRAPVEVEASAASPRGQRARRDRRRTPGPGGHISAFCEPERTTSMPQASVSSGTAPSDEIASTTSVALADRLLDARARRRRRRSTCRTAGRARRRPGLPHRRATSSGVGRLAPLVADRPARRGRAARRSRSSARRTSRG